jgi:hypothetical protein
MSHTAPAHQLNIDAAQRELDSRAAQGESVSHLRVCQQTARIIPAPHTTFSGALGIRMDRICDLWMKLAKRSPITIDRGRQLCRRLDGAMALGESLAAQEARIIPAATSLPLAPTPDDEDYLNGLHAQVIDPAIRARVIVERAIIRRAITDVLAAGYLVRVHDGEDWACEPTLDLGVLMAAIMATDEEKLVVYRHDSKGAKWVPHGWIFLVHGNDGWDVINDYTTNLEDVLKGATELGDAIAEADFLAVVSAPKAG